MNANESPFIERHLSDAEVYERRLLLEQHLDEQDKLSRAIDDKKFEIKKTTATLERVKVLVSNTRNEIKTRIVLEPRPPEPPRQGSLPMTGLPLTELPGTDVFTPSNLRPPLQRTCDACDAVEGAVTLAHFGKVLLCTAGTGCSGEAVHDVETTDEADAGPDVSLSTPEDEAAIEPRGAVDVVDLGEIGGDDAAGAAYDQGLADTIAANQCSECRMIVGHKLDCSQRYKTTLPDPYAKFDELYPLASNPASLHLELTKVLPAEELPSMAQVAEWHPSSGVFNAVAEWARIERAHYESRSRALDGKPAIGGLTIPARLPMPQKLVEVSGGEQRTPSGKKRREKPAKKNRGKAATE